jgi:hypothetical protein
VLPDELSELKAWTVSYMRGKDRKINGQRKATERRRRCWLSKMDDGGRESRPGLLNDRTRRHQVWALKGLPMAEHRVDGVGWRPIQPFRSCVFRSSSMWFLTNFVLDSFVALWCVIERGPFAPLARSAGYMHPTLCGIKPSVSFKH